MMFLNRNTCNNKIKLSAGVIFQSADKHIEVVQSNFNDHTFGHFRHTTERLEMKKT